MIVPSIVPDEALEAFIDHLNYDGTHMSKYGKELEFLERHDFDPSITNALYYRFGDWVNRFESPIAILRHDGSYDEFGRDADFVRSVALQLRSYWRARFDRPRLTEDDVVRFEHKWEPLPHCSNILPYGNPELIENYSATTDQVALAADYLLRTYPAWVLYFRAVKEIAPSEGYIGADRIYGYGMGYVFGSEALRAVIPNAYRYFNVHHGWDVIEKVGGTPVSAN